MSRPSRIAELAVEGAVRLLPAARRARYREEWLADLAGADAAGPSRVQIVVGALRVVVIAPRTPEAFGMPAGELAGRRLRWASALLVAAGVMMLGAFLGLPYLGGVLGQATGGLLTAAIATCGLTGTCLAAFAVHGALAGARPGSRWAGTVGAVIAVPLALVTVMAMLVPLSMVGLLAGVVLAGLAAGLPISADVERRRTIPGLPARVGTRATALVGALAVSAAAGLGAVNQLVWNPMAKVPGLALDEIYGQMAARGESPQGATVPVVVWAVGWALLALVLLATAVCGDRGLLRCLDARRIARSTLVALALIGFTQWIAGFGMGMSIADAFMTDGGSATPIGAVLVAVGTAAGVIAALRVLPPGSGAAAIRARS